MCATPQAPVGFQLAQQCQRGGPGVGGDGEAGRGRAGCRYGACENPRRDCQRQDDADHHMSAFGRSHGDAAGDGAREDRQEGRAFHERVAGGKLGRLQLLRQHAVFDWAEQRGHHAEQAKRDE